MSYLYLATSSIGEPLAIKILLPKFIKHKEVVSRFLQEAQIIKMTNHPNIVKLYGEGEWEKGLYIAMEWIHGISLRQFIEQKSLSIKRALEIVLQVGYALCHLHTHGVIHRDLKPENILITESGGVKVIDFGIAQLLDKKEKEPTKKKQLIGTPSYMSPEQKQDPQSVTFASDLYSLGMIAYELLVGKLSFSTLQLTALPKDIREILEKALQKSPKQRYSDAVDFITDIAKAIKNLETPLEKPETPRELLEFLESGKEPLFPKALSWPFAKIGFSVEWAKEIGKALYLDFFPFGQTLALAIGEAKEENLFDLLFFRGAFQMACHLHFQNKKLLSHPIQLLQSVNQLLFEKGIKISLSFLLLDGEKEQLIFLSLGGSQLIHLPFESTAARLLATPNPELGTAREIPFLETVDNWNEKDTLILTSKAAFDSLVLEKLEKEIPFTTPEHLAEKILSESKSDKSSAAVVIQRN